MIGLETDLLDGLRFACRPDCGLCCYASPAVTGPERTALLQLTGEADWHGPAAAIPARPNGGACQYLRSCRCSVHAARPFPCAEFPIAVHLGPRAQATAVLSCPGLDPAALRAPAAGRAPLPSAGLDSELAAVGRALEDLDPRSRARAERDWARALREVGASDPLARQERATVLGDSGPLFLGDPVEPWLPTELDGLDHLPLFFDARYGRVALASSGPRVELLALRESGGVERRLASFDPPQQWPDLEPPAEALLQGYRAYLLARDGFVGSAVSRALEDGPTSLVEVLREDLAEVLGTVMVRAVWRERLDGRAGSTLSATAVAAGIAATDADYLDRPTAGAWL